MKNMKKFLALCLTGAMAVSMAACGSSGDDKAAGEEDKQTESTAKTDEEKDSSDSKEKEKLVISCYLADDSQVAVREKYIDGPLKEAFPDVDIEIKMYNDRQSLQVEVAGGGGPDIIHFDLNIHVRKSFL